LEGEAIRISVRPGFDETCAASYKLAARVTGTAVLESTPGEDAGETFGVRLLQRSSQGARIAATDMRSKGKLSAPGRGKKDLRVARMDF
jgi:hypothetical protein